MNIIMSRALHQQHSLHRPSPPPVPPSSPLDFTDKIPIRELKISNETLGSGSFGTVFKGSWRGRPVAVKQFRTREEIDSFLVEVKQLSCVRHPNIVTLFGASVQLGHGSDTAYLVMEYAEGGSLNHLLHECKQQQYDLRHACTWALQTAEGVAYLHEIRPKPIMHRDLKPANLLLFSRGKTLKICDFGTACTVKTQMTNNTGSASYMAPEVFATSSYLESGDVYSWSIIFWEILARQHPYSQQCSNPFQILWRVKQNGTRPNNLEECPKIIWDLITRSWDKDPKRRPSMRQVANEMKFISQFTPKVPPQAALATALALATASASATATATTSNSQYIAATSPSYANYSVNNMIHPQAQNINSQPRRFSSADEMGRPLVSSPLGPFQTHCQLPYSVWARSSPGTSERVSPSSIHERELTHHRRALIHHLDKLKKQAEALQESGPREKLDPYKVIDEIKKLKAEEREKQVELKQRWERIKSLANDFNNIYLDSSRSIDCE